jgi:ATP-binding cassette, subfamily B, bacterial PglK
MMLNKSSTTKNILQLFFKMAPKELRNKFFLLSFLMVIGSILELASIGMIIPIIYTISSPEGLVMDTRFEYIYQIFGGQEPKVFIINLLIAFGIFFILSSIGRFLIMCFNMSVSYEFGRYLSKRLLELMLSPNLRNIHPHQHSKFVNLITAKSINITNGIILPTFMIFNTLMLSVLLLIAGLSISPGLFLVSILFFSGVYLTFGLFLKPKLERNSKLISNMLPKQMKFSIDIFGSFREIIINSLSEVGVKRFAENDKLIKNLTRNNYILSLAPRYVIEPLVVIILVLAALAISYDIIDSTSSIAFMGVMAFSLQRFLPVFQGAYTGWSNIQSESSILAELIKILKLNNNSSKAEVLSFKKILPANDAINIKATDDYEILFKSTGLAHAYNNKDFIFRNANIEINRGDRIAIIGESGSGKSTLIDIIMGIIHPTKGELLYSGYQADASAPFLNYWKFLSYVPQDIRFFNDTLANNINLLSNNKPNETRLSKAIDFASLKYLVERLDHGLDQKVEDDGSNFSGGERQRIGLARAMYKKDTNFIIFDEPTSALDRDTSQYILDSIRNLDSKITVLMITHNESLLSEFNKVYKIDDGSVNLFSRK